MLFNSLQYACFLPASVLVYHISPPRAKVFVLLIASYLFYASWDAKFIVLIFGLTVFNFLLGRAIEESNASSKASSLLLGSGITINLGFLVYYKYTLFLVSNANSVLNAFGSESPITGLSIILPLALSFFTFEFIHYLIDVANGTRAVKSFVNFAVFACFFPTQVAGPIKRFEQFVPQLEHPPSFSPIKFWSGCKLLAGGLFKKVALADNLATIVNVGFGGGLADAGTAPWIDAWVVSIAFALQLYFDFSGYTDMGRGSALLLGFDVPENFLRPYLSRNVSEFWRRWHVSLSSWLRDYLYIPLGGNRGARDRNLMITMLLGGVWHGANWTFLIWGGLHGTYLIIFRHMSGGITEAVSRFGTAGNLLNGMLGWSLTFFGWCLSMVFFRAESLGDAVHMVTAMFSISTAPVFFLNPLQRLAVLVVLAGCLVFEGFREWQESRRAANGFTEDIKQVRRLGGKVLLEGIAYTLLLAFTLVAQPATGARFIYFQF
jgi:alginate O-acetyltransferase complex protein AlgI